VRWSKLQGSGGASRYLLHLDPLQPLRVARTSALSRMQREVAQLAASGATAPEIAQMMALAPSTVRTHLRLIYRSLEVSSRAELARAVDESA
jgi:DNA-binding CsgD family transcriptional regulator